MAIVLAFGLVAVAAAPSVSASTAMPTWSAGDYWVYTLNAGTLIPGFNGAATLRYDVVGPDSLNIGGSSVSVWKTKLNVSVAFSSGSISVTLYFNGNAWFRQSDLAPAEQTFTTSYGGSTISLTVSYDPPQAIQWPLAAPAQWNTTTNVTSSVSGGTPSTIQETFENTVQTDTSLTVPAGTFTVTPVKQETGGGLSLEYTIYYWSATAGNYVSQRNYYSSNDTPAGSIDLKSYSYGAGVGASFLGLPILAWIIIVAVIVVAVAAVVLLRRKKPMPPMMPPGTPPMQGPPPQEPPQMPPGPPPQP